MSQLANVIQARREDISQRWADQLFDEGVPESVQREDVLDSVREFLDAITAGLRTDQGFEQHPDTAEASGIAKGHGKQRFSLGYDLAAMVREYGTLRDVLFQVVEEAGATPSVRDLSVLSKYLIGGIADAAAQYALEREAELRQQAARHIGFLAHELRNPLASLRLVVDVMRHKGELPPGRSAQRLEQGLTRLSELIDNSLVEMRLRVIPEPQREPVDMGALLQALVEEVAADVESKRLHISVEVPPGLRLQADRRLLHSAFSNLVRNAAKFTREGGALHLYVKEGDNRVTVNVEDECGGLPEGRIQALFNPFVQVGQDRSGFGLGLAIAKQAAEAHGGELRVHNLPGRGCVFVLDLPTNLSPP